MNYIQLQRNQAKDLEENKLVRLKIKTFQKHAQHHENNFCFHFTIVTENFPIRSQTKTFSYLPTH